MTADRERVALAAFVTAAALAGGNAICIRFSNRELARLWAPAYGSRSPPPCLGRHGRAQPQAPAPDRP